MVLVSSSRASVVARALSVPKRHLSIPLLAAAQDGSLLHSALSQVSEYNFRQRRYGNNGSTRLGL